MDEKRYPYFGIPPARQPRPATDEPTLRGKRVILSTPEGFVYDMRAVSQTYESQDGEDLVGIASEVDFFRWMLQGTPPEVTAYPSGLVWVE